MESMEQFQEQFDANSEVDLLKKHRIKITEKIDPPPPVIQIDNLTQYPITIFTEGNLSVISGKAKARKSFAVAMLTAATVSNDWIYRKFRGVPENKVIYFDTEQSSFYVQQAYKRIDSMSQGDDINKRFYCYALRSLSVQQRVDVIDYVFKHTEDLGFVVIDGIRDLMKDINSAEESTDLSTKLMQAETVLGVEKMEGDEKYISKITCRMLRGIDFDDIYFTINQYGVPEVLANYIEPEHRTNGLQ
jgi:hypothetical protein